MTARAWARLLRPSSGLYHDLFCSLFLLLDPLLDAWKDVAGCQNLFCYVPAPVNEELPTTYLKCRPVQWISVRHVQIFTGLRLMTAVDSIGCSPLLTESANRYKNLMGGWLFN